MEWLALTGIMTGIVYVTLTLLAVSTRLQTLPPDASGKEVRAELWFVISGRAWFL
jgi:hypothetical protein